MTTAIGAAKSTQGRCVFANDGNRFGHRTKGGRRAREGERGVGGVGRVGEWEGGWVGGGGVGNL